MNEQNELSGSQPAVKKRLLSLDAYRGLVMLAIASNGLGITRTAEKFPENQFWQTLAYQFEHVPWIGCGFWDLIQPSFMFMVGVSMAYSYVKRQSQGDSYGAMLRHAMVRSVVLVALGVFLSSNGSEMTNYTFVNVLTQIGLGYTFLFLLWGRKPFVQFWVAMGVLVGYWALFALAPLPGEEFNFAAVGVGKDWQYLSGFAAHWQKNANVAASFDLWLLNFFPRPEVFVFNGGGYQTLNFVPSLATMIFGLMAGELMRSNSSGTRKFWLLVTTGLIGLAVGWALHHFGICPLVKRIWTPSWAIYSTGWTCLLLAFFYGSIDLVKFRAWAFPLVVVGTNSITMYCMSQMLKPWVHRNLETHFGEDYVRIFGTNYLAMVQAISVMLVLWLICYWLYRQKVFLKI